MRNALVAAAFLLSGCGLLTAEIDVERVGVIVPNNQFKAPASSTSSDWCDPNAPPTPAEPACMAAALDYDLGSYVPALTDNSVTYDLRLTDVDITLSAGELMTDLAAIESAVVRVGYVYDSATSTVVDPGTVVASYYKEPGSNPTTIAVSGKSEVDLGPYLDAGKLPVRVEVVLDYLTPAFKADIQAGFSLMMKVDWGSYVF